MKALAFWTPIVATGIYLIGLALAYAFPLDLDRRR